MNVRDIISLSQCDAAVIANNYERHTLWEWHSQRYGREWESSCIGYMVTVGHITMDGKDRPVVFCWSAAKIDGTIIAFVDATSQIVDWPWIEEYVSNAMGQGKRIVDAMNMNNVLGGRK